MGPVSYQLKNMKVNSPFGNPSANWLGSWTRYTSKIQRRDALSQGVLGMSSVFFFACTLLIWPVEGACALQLNVVVETIQPLKTYPGNSSFDRMSLKGARKKYHDQEQM